MRTFHVTRTEQGKWDVLEIGGEHFGCVVDLIAFAGAKVTGDPCDGRASFIVQARRVERLMLLSFPAKYRVTFRGE